MGVFGFRDVRGRRNFRHGGHSGNRRAGAAVVGLGLDAVGTGANAEWLAETDAEASSVCGGGAVALVCFADAAEGGETLFHGGVAHAAGVEVVGEAVVTVRRGISCGSGWLFSRGFLSVFGVLAVLFGVLAFFGWVEINAAEMVISKRYIIH